MSTDPYRVRAAGILGAENSECVLVSDTDRRRVRRAVSREEIPPCGSGLHVRGGGTKAPDDQRLRPVFQQTTSTYPDGLSGISRAA
jgi:hypothetical protein